MEHIETYCCDDMRAMLEHRCELHMPEECPDRVIVIIGRLPMLPIRDGGTSGVEIRYCPWCGREVRP